MILKPVGEHYFELVKDFKVDVLGYKITVPKGFRSDLASVPRIFWPIIPRHGRYTIAAIVHDYLCKSMIINSDDTHFIFKILMRRYHVKPWRIKLMYKAVSWFGPRW